MISKKYIWYASYGSNINKERFLCYIAGGQPKGTSRIYEGCTDKSFPIDSKDILINSELYFAKESKTWEKGGVAFIKNHFDQKQKTHGRMYLITQEQFTEVVKQEMDYLGEVEIDFDLVKKNGTLLLKEDSWYGNLLYLGKEDSTPIFTFTFENDIQKINKPSKAYLKTIISGLSEIYPFNQNEIADYFLEKKGISEQYSRDEVLELIEI